jgi:hypothetical protein
LTLGDFFRSYYEFWWARLTMVRTAWQRPFVTT